MESEIKMYQSEDEKTDLTENNNLDVRRKIITIRNTQVILDKDLAELYGVETKVLNQAVKRNIDKFPSDFRFQLTKEECLRSQIVTLKQERGQHLKYLPNAFTEQGVAMLSAVLKSKTAIAVSIEIMRTFVALRHIVNNNSPLYKRMSEIEQKQMQTDYIIDEILNKLEEPHSLSTQGIFFNGQIFDAYQFVSDLIRSAKQSKIENADVVAAVRKVIPTNYTKEVEAIGMIKYDF